MTRKTTWLKRMVCILLVISVTIASLPIGYTVVSTYEGDNPAIHEWQDQFGMQTLTVTHNDLDECLTIIGTVSIHDRAMLYYAWSQIPMHIRARMHNRELEVIVVDINTIELNDMHEINNPTEGAVGYCLTGARTVMQTDDGWVVTEFHNHPRIYIQAGTNCSVANILRHEVGHFISDVNPDPRTTLGLARTDKFENLYNRYHDVIAYYDDEAHVNTYSAVEMFAESYRIYLANPTWLQNNAAPVYAYMQEASQEFYHFEYAVTST